MDDQWEPLEISGIRSRFASTPTPWWVAGDHAIDLFLGWETRAHADIAIDLFRSDRGVLFDVFHAWDLNLMSGGELVPFERGDDVAEEVFGVWGRPSRGEPWAVEVMLADGDMDEWRFRRDNVITLPGDRLVQRTDDGLP